MDRLSTCYFCGSATVGDLGAVRVAGDEAADLTLCGDCTDKLDRLVSAAGGSLTLSATPDATGTPAAGDSATGDGQTDEDDTPGAPDAPDAGLPDDAKTFTGSDEDPFGDDPLAESREPAPESPGEKAADDGTTAGTDDEGRERAGSKLGRATDASGRADPPGTGSASGVTDDEESEPRSVRTSQAAGGRRKSSHGTRGGRTEEPTDGDGGGGDDPAAPSPDAGEPSADTGDGAVESGADTGDRTGEPEPDTGEGPDGSEAPDDTGTPTSVSRETYNKVVRLLQNREFPVERASVIEVATSAYGLSRRDCDATIDTLVDRGVLETGEDDEGGERLFRA